MSEISSMTTDKPRKSHIRFLRVHHMTRKSTESAENDQLSMSPLLLTNFLFQISLFSSFRNVYESCESRLFMAPTANNNMYCQIVKCKFLMQPYPCHVPNYVPHKLAVISGDSLVLRGRPGPQGQPPKERSVDLEMLSSSLDTLSRILHLADVTAPRLGTSSREDEV
jgi:hypothetical protein